MKQNKYFWTNKRSGWQTPNFGADPVRAFAPVDPRRSPLRSGLYKGFCPPILLVEVFFDVQTTSYGLHGAMTLLLPTLRKECLRLLTRPDEATALCHTRTSVVILKDKPPRLTVVVYVRRPKARPRRKWAASVRGLWEGIENGTGESIDCDRHQVEALC